MAEKEKWRDVSDAQLKALGHLTRAERIAKTVASATSPEELEWGRRVSQAGHDRAKRSGKPWGWTSSKATDGEQAKPTPEQSADEQWSPPTSWKITTLDQLSLLPAPVIRNGCGRHNCGAALVERWARGNWVCSQCSRPAGSR